MAPTAAQYYSAYSPRSLAVAGDASHVSPRARRGGGGRNGSGTCPDCRGPSRPDCCKKSIQHDWKVMPERVKDFVLHSGHMTADGFISVDNLISFWSSPVNAVLTERIDICGASWYLVRNLFHRHHISTWSLLSMGWSISQFIWHAWHRHSYIYERDYSRKLVH